MAMTILQLQTINTMRVNRQGNFSQSFMNNMSPTMNEAINKEEIS